MNGPTETPQQGARRLAASAMREGYKPEALYTYTHPDGGVWYWRIRLKNPHTGEKWIRPMRLNGSGLELGEPGFPDGKPLYRLHDLTGRPDDRVIVVEGEWCADALAKVGVLATTSGAADSAARADWRSLAGRDVTIWPDNDEAGRSYEDALADALLPLGCTVRVIDVDKLGLPKKGDAVDWCKANPAATAADIAALPCVGARQRARVGAKAPAGGEPIPGTGTSPGGFCGSEEWPGPMDPCAYYGIAGEMVTSIEPHTEADPAALLIQVAVAFGVLVGRSPYVQVEGDRHYPNLFAILIGATSKGRKGTSWGRVRSIFERVHGWPRVVSGLSSGEGLKWQVRDPRTEMVKDKKSGVTTEEVVDEGVPDKRLLVIEPEFAQILRVVARHGNTLSSTTRTAWDTGTLATLTKNDPVTATDAHIAIIGHITIDELRAELTQTDTANGFANRFLFLCVKRSKCLPFGGADLPESMLGDFAQRLERAASSARRVGRVVMTQPAREIWERVYPQLSEGMLGLFGAATARAEAQVVRLAMLYALLDRRRRSTCRTCWRHSRYGSTPRQARGMCSARAWAIRLPMRSFARSGPRARTA